MGATVPEDDTRIKRFSPGKIELIDSLRIPKESTSFQW
jgi:hypothetical protein